MKVLIIDDTEYKIQALNELLKGLSFISQVVIARSFHGGLNAITQTHPDLILLDMSLPTSEQPDGEPEGRTRMYGGRDILAELDDISLATKAIIVTQFDHFGEGANSITLDSLLKQLKSQYSNHLLSGIYYSNVDSEWQQKLKTILDSLASQIL